MVEFDLSALAGARLLFSCFHGRNFVAFCMLFQGGPRPMQRLNHLSRIAELPMGLNLGSEWTSSARFR